MPEATLFDEPEVIEKPLLGARPYQEQAINAVLEDFKSHRRCLLVSATATGKTVMLGHICDRLPGDGKILILAHRRELIYQARNKVGIVTGDRPSVEMASSTGNHHGRIVVGSIQTQIAGKNEQKRYLNFDPLKYCCIIIDECHRALSASYRSVIKHYMDGNPDCKLLGVTATPDRTDKKALAKVFEKVSFVYPMQQAVKDGWIVNPRAMPIQVLGLDFSRIKTTAGDLNSAELEEVLLFEKNLHRMAEPLLKESGNKQVLAFCAGVAHAQRFAEILNRMKPDCARHVSGKTPPEERKHIFAAYERKEFQILCNVGIVTEGTDLPGVEVVALCRPTKSRALFEQMVGRGVRPAAEIAEALGECVDQSARLELIRESSKPYCSVLDFCGNAGQHKLITVADILGGDMSEQVKTKAARIAKEESEQSGIPADIFDCLEKAEDEIKREIAERKRKEQEESNRRRHLIAKVDYRVGSADVFEFYDIRPPQANLWKNAPMPTQPMADFLEKRGIDASTLTSGEASRLISELQGRITIKQANILSRAGYAAEELKKMPMIAASKLIDRCKKNNWRRPSEQPVVVQVGGKVYEMPTI